MPFILLILLQRGAHIPNGYLLGRLRNRGFLHLLTRWCLMGVWSRSAVAILLLRRGSLDRPTDETKSSVEIEHKAETTKRKEERS